MPIYDSVYNRLSFPLIVYLPSRRFRAVFYLGSDRIN